MIKWIAVALLATLSSACAKSNEPAQGSQTHFLETCETGCPAPYECLCGACTVTCERASTCEDEASEAECVAVAGTCGGGAERACEVECEGDEDCRSLSARHRCDDGRCRAPASEAMDPQSSDALCDGSNNMRLGYTSETGYGAEDPDGPSSFYGKRFFFVDGQCNYFASLHPQRGTVTGHLDRAEATELEALIEWRSMSELAAQEDVNDCMSTELEYLWAPSFLVTPCECTCPNTPTAAKKVHAFEGALEFLMSRTLPGTQLGTPLTTPLLAFATSDRAPTDGDVSWPLERSLASVPRLIGDAWDQRDTPVVAFSDPNEAELLRALRDPENTEQYVRIRVGERSHYLFLRDALPAGTEQKINALRAQPEPFCLGDHTSRQGGGIFECGDGRLHRERARSCANPTLCTQDSDCGPGEACVCNDEGASSVCQASGCASDGDCGGTFCSFGRDACSSSGFHCPTPDDECEPGMWPCVFNEDQGHHRNGASSCD